MAPVTVTLFNPANPGQPASFDSAEYEFCAPGSGSPNKYTLISFGSSNSMNVEESVEEVVRRVYEARALDKAEGA